MSIGTGSTAIQIVAALIDEVAELSLFQRTAQWVMPQENQAYSETEKSEFRQHPDKLRELRSEISQMFAEGFSNAVVDVNSEHLALIEAMCKANLEGKVKDPDLRERLRPNYRAACKRLIMSEDFYDAIQRPNAKLVTEGIERIEESGIRTNDGHLHGLDVLILATGFRVDRFMRPMEVVGRNGITLEDAWAQRPSAYMAISIPDFPNLFMLNGPNGPVGNFSLIEVAELQFSYIMQLVEQVQSKSCREVSATRGATEQFDADRVEAAKNTVWQTGCNSWYLDDRGVPAVWPWSFSRFREEMAQPCLSDYEMI